MSRTAEAAARKRAAAAAQAAVPAQPSLPQQPASPAAATAPQAAQPRATQPQGTAAAAPQAQPSREAPPARAASAAAATSAAAERRTASRNAPATSAAPDPSAQDAPLSAFFRGAGLKQRGLNEQENNAALFLLGQLVRELLTGLSESLHLRAQQKTQLRLANTTIQKQDNNPLKFSAGTTEALENLLFRNSKEYMGPVEAVRDAYADICSHQLALLKALATAVPEYVNRLDPVVLEDKFARSARTSLVGAATRLKHWELYKDLFQVVAHHAPGHLPPQFLEELGRAYEAESEREATLRGRSKRQANVN
jgi:type VI secretion system FHA domain protein